MAPPTTPKHLRSPLRPKSDAAAMYSSIAVIGFVALILLASIRDDTSNLTYELAEIKGNRQLARRPCDEIYVVGESETLHSISEKCSDPFIVENNPHIHDPDDVFPGLVIRITPSNLSNFSR